MPPSHSSARNHNPVKPRSQNAQTTFFRGRSEFPEKKAWERLRVTDVFIHQPLEWGRFYKSGIRPSTGGIRTSGPAQAAAKRRCKTHLQLPDPGWWLCWACLVAGEHGCAKAATDSAASAKGFGHFDKAPFPQELGRLRDGKLVAAFMQKYAFPVGTSCDASLAACQGIRSRPLCCFLPKDSRNGRREGEI